MNDLSAYRRIIGGEAGWWAVPVRVSLRLLEGLFSVGVSLRNRRYDRDTARTVLPVPVISVGNITTGGTGKTPLVIDLVQRLERMGRNPAVISRGYKAAPGEPNDEERLIRKHCPSVVCLADPDRVRAGQVALEQFGADVLVLDDGFQHRRLARALDLVVVDATCPFGFGHLLPRGLLREPIHNLARAHVIVVSRSDQVSKAALARLEARLHDLARRAVHLKCKHRVIGVEGLDGAPLEGVLDGRRAVLFAGIGQPNAFKSTVRACGVEIVGEWWWPDHHHYTRADINRLLKVGAFPRHDLLMTTEKDAVKLRELKGPAQADIAVVRIAIDFVGDGGTMLQRCLEETLAKS